MYFYQLHARVAAVLNLNCPVVLELHWHVLEYLHYRIKSVEYIDINYHTRKTQQELLILATQVKK